jgi:hypothetical protein
MGTQAVDKYIQVFIGILDVQEMKQRKQDISKTATLNSSFYCIF